MQDPRLLNQPKQKSRKTFSANEPMDYMRGVQEGSPALPLKGLPKASKKVMKNDVNAYYQPQVQQRTRPSMQQESVAANEYRALRRKFLELEQENCSLGNEVVVAEHEIQSLEDEKLQLLDELIVLEGLVDPSEAHTK